VIAHVVFFEPRKEASEEDRSDLIESLSTACREIGSVLRANVGTRLSLGLGYESLFGAKTYSYCAVIEFADKDGLMAYLAHPLHEKLGQLFWKVCESTMIADVEMQPAGGASVISL
jgi:hypothetical protein